MASGSKQRPSRVPTRQAGDPLFYPCLPGRKSHPPSSHQPPGPSRTRPSTSAASPVAAALARTGRPPALRQGEPARGYRRERSWPAPVLLQPQVIHGKTVFHLLRQQVLAALVIDRARQIGFTLPA